MEYIFLTQKFFDDYKNCPEIEQKQNRPYVLVRIVVNGIPFGVPMRSNIHHRHVLWTDEERGAGLDFSKTVVLHKAEYVDKSNTPHIRKNEFEALRGKEHIVKQQLQRYIHNYKRAKKRLDVPRNHTLCAYSTLQYFEKYI